MEGEGGRLKLANDHSMYRRAEGNGKDEGVCKRRSLPCCAHADNHFRASP